MGQSPQWDGVVTGAIPAATSGRLDGSGKGGTPTARFPTRLSARWKVPASARPASRSRASAFPSRISTGTSPPAIRSTPLTLTRSRVNWSSGLSASAIPAANADGSPVSSTARGTSRSPHLILRLPPGYGLLPEVLARLRELPSPA